MKNLLFTLALLISFIGFSQTPITDANFFQAIETCLSTNPVDGMCSDSEYGAMPDWDVSQVTNMSYAFVQRNDFNADLSNWNVSAVTDMAFMFSDCSDFNQPIGNWDVSSVTDMSWMFYFASAFNQPIGDWDVSSVTDMDRMFSYAYAFNEPIGDWDVSNVTNMQGMFEGAYAFNQPIGDWDVSSVTEMGSMFSNSSFNQPIGDWDVSSVTNMNRMFNFTDAFNQDIGDWDVSSVTSMESMFSVTPFNQPIGDWDVGSVTNMDWMFAGTASFNQPIGDWDVSNVTNMDWMFYQAESFNQDISSWCVTNIVSEPEAFTTCLPLAGDYTINMFDSYGDGWQTGDYSQGLSLNLDGEITMIAMCSQWGDWEFDCVQTTDGYYAQTTVTIPEGTQSAYWIFPGDQYGEISVQIIAPNGVVAYESETGDTIIGILPIAVCAESTLIESNKPVWGTCPSLGIDDLNQVDVLIYPNPVIDKLFIQGLSNPTKISVYDILGKLVLSKTTSSEINVDNLQSGIYILKIVDNQKEIVRRFIKK